MDWRRVCGSWILALATTAAASSALAGFRSPHLWEKRTIEVVICTASEPDPDGRKQCGKAAPLLDAARTALVRDAVVEWNTKLKGHIEFKEVAAHGVDVVWIAGGVEPDDCSVNDEGYTRGAPRYILIGTTCSDQPRTTIGSVLHEMGHIAGLIHEQRRPDRGEYIKYNMRALYEISRSGTERTMNWAGQYAMVCNIADPGPCSPDFEPNPLTAQYVREFGIIEGPYDFDSVMHYSFYPPEKSREDVFIDVTTVGALRLRDQGLAKRDVGQRNRLSAGDIATLKSIYP